MQTAGRQLTCVAYDIKPSLDGGQKRCLLTRGDQIKKYSKGDRKRKIK